MAAEILLNRGHLVDILDKKGNSPLSIAASSNAVNSIRILVKYGA